MLVLSRKQGEQIRIGDDIVVTVHRLSGNRVSIGIEAPSSCRIVRGELKAIVESLDAKPSPGRDAKSPVLPLGGNRIAEHLAQTLNAPK